MILKKISLINFKNHESVQLDFSNHINCFLGNNGVGKTNLLDAIHYLSFCKSYYNSFESDNVKYGELFFMLKGDFLNQEGLEFKIHCALKNKKKQFKLNDKKYDKLSNHIGKIPLVIITPLDSAIILGGGDERRRFIDRLLSQLDNKYLHQLMSYNKVLQQRNSLLKEFNSTTSHIDLLSTYDTALSNYGNKIYLKRKESISMIIDNVQEYYDFISKKNESVNIVYKSQLENKSFEEMLGENREKDKILKFTTTGIHRDDFVFHLNMNSLKKSGSQGQQKTFLISLKFAYFALLKSLLGSTPILLLDDIFDKLDDTRVEQIVRIMNKNEFGQIFITDTNLDRVDAIMKRVDIICKYFIFDKKGLCHEKFKN